MMQPCCGLTVLQSCASAQYICIGWMHGRAEVMAGEAFVQRLKPRGPSFGATVASPQIGWQEAP